MYLLFEGKDYKRTELENIKLDSRFYSDDEKSIVCKCGYCRPSESDSPIFCLPKVFIKGNGRFLGRYPVEGVIDTSSEAFLVDPSVKNIFFSLSTWLYSAIRTYQKRMAHKSTNTSIIDSSGSQNILSNIGEDDYTQLDVIKAMHDFYKKNNALFVKVARQAHSRLTKISWSKTVSKKQPFFQDGTPIYFDLLGTRKEIDYDEQLLTLYFSTLNFVAEKFGMFEFHRPAGYTLYSPQYIEDNLNSGKIECTLQKIKRNYFSDKMRYLWQLLFMFYSETDVASSEQNGNKYLMVHSFQNVFEDMIDYLIGDEVLPDKKLKDQKDGHQIDHIFKYQSLIFRNESIFYVGDSKYYKEHSNIEEYSEEKQYTYAHNVIKYNMDFFRNPHGGNFKEYIGRTRYRDELTEGYAITPNFFISGIINDPTDYYNNDFEPRCDRSGHPEPPKQASYFDDRLFDRDTLFLQHYDINFLFVLSSYVSGNNTDRNVFKQELQEKLRLNFISFFNDKYNFYSVIPQGGYDTFVEKFFRILVGKLFCTTDNRLILALEKDPRDYSEQELIWKKLKGMCKVDKFILQ